VSLTFRDAVLDLSEHHAFARRLVNSGRLSVPSVYDGSPLNGADDDGLPPRTRPGAPAADAPVGGGWLVDRLGGGFQLLTIGAEAPDDMTLGRIPVERVALALEEDATGALRERYLGDSNAAIYLMRPDQHIAARWKHFDAKAVSEALRRATGQE
jgi:3-(3-hydroxy-phenyl)propionate hydroxylase